MNTVVFTTVNNKLKDPDPQGVAECFHAANVTTLAFQIY